MNIEGYKGLKTRLLEQDAKRDAAFDYYTRIYHNDWTLPPGMSKYSFLRPVTDHSPHDAVRAGVNTLSSLPPKPRVIPSKADDLQKQQANKWERNLKWQLMNANRRRPVSVESDVATSAILYGAVALMVVDLDWQIKQVGALGADTKRLEAARRYGRFVVNTFSPRDVHILRSSYGVEKVLLCQRKLASEVCYEWGNESEKLRGWAEEGKVVNYYDVMDYEERCVWVELENSGDSVLILDPTKYDLPFMPWVAMMGGSTLEAEPMHQYHPMLYPLYTSGDWELLNITETLAFYETVVQAFKPDIFNIGAGEIEEDYTNPSRIANVPIGNSIQQVGQKPLDPAKTELMDRLNRNIERATVPSILQGGGGNVETFATLNLKTQTAMGMLAPAKALMENALAEMFTLMLLWTAHTGVDLSAKGIERRTDLGEEYTIESDTIDTENLYITVSVDPKVPTDQMQKANVANMIVPLGYPKEMALEDLGVDDPQAAITMSYMEQLKDFIFQQGLQAMSQQQQMDMQGQQAMLEQQMQAQQGAQEEAMQGPVMGGQGFNPAMGGTPPAEAAPTYTREDVMGQDMMGNEVPV